MNFSNVMQESLSKDYNRLIQLCSSYGLNEQQTNQIISDFKNGSFALQDQSIDESFHQSIRDLDSNHYDEGQRSLHEEYSFKHQKIGNGVGNGIQGLKKAPAMNAKNQHQQSNADSFEQQSRKNEKNMSCSGANEDFLEFFINQQKQFERTIQNNLERQNAYLKDELRKKEEKIETFMKIKMQDSDVILGLKDSITSLTTLVQEKDQAYRFLLEKYEKLKIQTEGVSTQKTSKTQLSHQQSLNSFQQRKSLIRQKQNCLTEVQPNRMTKKSSQKYIKQIPTRNPPRLTEKIAIQNRENVHKNDQSKRSGIDIGKYKGMIEKLRNSYQFR